MVEVVLMVVLVHVVLEVWMLNMFVEVEVVLMVVLVHVVMEVLKVQKVLKVLAVFVHQVMVVVCSL